MNAGTWSLEDTNSSASDISSSGGSWESDLVDVAVGIGVWKMYKQTTPRARHTATNGKVMLQVGLSTDGSTSMSYYEQRSTGYAFGDTSSEGGLTKTFTINDNELEVASKTTYYGLVYMSGTVNQLRRCVNGETVLRFTSAFF